MSKNEAVTIKTTWEFEKVSRNKENENHLLINIIGGEANEDESRKPVALQGVIDCSGSMNGSKIEYVRKTLMVLVDHLTENDYLGLTAYSDSVWEICPSTKCDKSGKQKIKESIKKEVKAISSTNLSGGFIEGFEVLKSKDFGDQCLQRILLLTDGMANSGITGHENIVNLVKRTLEKNSNISLSTFGYGSGDENRCDFDPEILSSMAKTGKGNYHHISSPDKVPGALGTEIGGLLSCVAQNIKVSLHLNDDIKVLDVLNDFDVKTKDNVTTITIDDIYAEEEKAIVVNLKIPSFGKSIDRSVKMLDVEVSYLDVVMTETKNIKEPIKLSFVKSGEESKTANKLVEKEIVLLAAATAQEKANDLADKGDHDGAIDAIEKGIEAIKDCSSYLKDKILQDLADSLNTLKPRYLRETYGSGVKAFASANSSMLRSRRLSTGGAQMYNDFVGTRGMSICAQSFEQSVDNFEEDEDDVQNNNYELKTTSNSSDVLITPTIGTTTSNLPFEKKRTRR